MPDSRGDSAVAMIQGVPLVHAAEEGSAYFSLSLAHAVRRLGMNVVIWTKVRPEPFVAQPVPVEATWTPGYGAWLDLLRTVRAKRPKIVHLQYSMFCLGPKASGEFSTLLFVIGAWLLRTTLVVTCHDVPSLARITPEFIRQNRYRFPVVVVKAGLRTIFFFIGFAARRLIVHHEWLRDTLVDDYHVPARKVRTIPLARIPFESYERGAARAAIGLAPDAAAVLYFGFATGYKGIDELLDAMDVLARRGSGVRLVLGAGYHPKKDDNAEYHAYYDALRARAAAMPNVDFVGFIHNDDLDRYVAAVDACIFPYIEFQGMSGPLLQAASQAKPLLVSSIIANSLGRFAASNFVPTAEGIALALERYFGDPGYRASVEAESAAFEAAAVANDAAEQTYRLYTSLGARRS
ncbi:MAG: hypothetical protein NVSMB19_10880 [Vulcanimicrobiaceae bacterium]